MSLYSKPDIVLSFRDTIKYTINLLYVKLVIVNVLMSMYARMSIEVLRAVSDVNMTIYIGVGGRNFYLCYKCESLLFYF